jgi:hypothetical protein
MMLTQDNSHGYNGNMFAKPSYLIAHINVGNHILLVAN